MVLLYTKKRANRLEALRYFVDVAVETRKRHDYYSLNAVLNALESSVIAKVNNFLTADLEERIEKTHRGYSYRRAEYAQNIAQLEASGTFFIPDIATMANDVSHILDGMPDKLTAKTFSDFPVDLKGLPEPLLFIPRLKRLDRMFHTLRIVQKYRPEWGCQPDRAMFEFLGLLSRYKPSEEVQEVSYFARAAYLNEARKNSYYSSYKSVQEKFGKSGGPASCNTADRRSSISSTGGERSVRTTATGGGNSSLSHESATSSTTTAGAGIGGGTGNSTPSAGTSTAGGGGSRSNSGANTGYRRILFNR